MVYSLIFKLQDSQNLAAKAILAPANLFSLPNQQIVIPWPCRAVFNPADLCP
jgi:hypothetical protein